MGETRYREIEQRLWMSLGLTPDERDVPLARAGTTARVLVVGEGRDVLFVHGGSASGANWAPLVAHLEGVRCLLLDRPGCGLSAPLDTDVSDLAAFGRHADGLVADVLDGLGIPSAAVVATSLGGHIALRGAAAHPERVDQLVEFGYVPGAPLEHVPLSMRLATLPGLGRLMASLPPPRRVVRVILRQLGMGDALRDGRISAEMFDWFHALLRDTPTMRNEIGLPRELLRADGEGGAAALPTDLLGRITCPVRFVWGEADPIGGSDVARRFVPLIPGAELDLWAGVGHAPWMEEPARAAATVTDFLGS